MIRFVFRVLGFLALVAAIGAGVFDAIGSVAAGHAVLTPFAEAWREAGAASIVDLGAFKFEAWPPAAGRAVSWVLAQPAFAVLVLLAFVFHCAGYRRRATSQRYALN